MRAAFKKLKNDGVNAEQALRCVTSSLHPKACKKSGHVAELCLLQALCVAGGIPVV